MISIDLNGRLGNQMFQYAVCRAVADKRGFEFHIPRSKVQGQHLSDFFELDLGLDTPETVYLFSEDHTRQTFNSKIFDIPDGTRIWGYYQSDKYFKEKRDILKKWFSVEIDEVTNDILNKYPIDEYCYVHFRGTDYRNWGDGQYFLPKSYYEKAISKIKDVYPNMKFVIVTDDPDLAKSFFRDEILSNDLMTDYKLLLSAKYCIIPNSTFSWWAAWLSEKKITIAPNNWLNYNNPHLGFNPEDMETERFTYI